MPQLPKERETVRDGVRGRIIQVKPRAGYTRFVPHRYDKKV
jgi:hypothetical protein